MYEWYNIAIAIISIQCYKHAFSIRFLNLNK